MKIVAAPASFKGSLSSAQAGRAIARGIRRARPDWNVVAVTLADGGEGMVESLAGRLPGERAVVRCEGPLGDPVDAAFLMYNSGRSAAIEMAASSGLPLIDASRRDPLVTSTRGTGQQVLRALDLGAQEILLGIGGSATVDGGAGMAQVLGYRLLDSRGRDLSPGGAALLDLDRIEASSRDPRIARTRFLVACDVRNVLLGPQGAAHVFGPQKGASPADCALLDRALARLAEVMRRDLGVSVTELAGGGAAGGLGAGAVAFLGATLRPGIELILDAIGFREHLRGASLSIAGEGRLDSQTPYGKAPAGVAAASKAAGIPCVAMAGSIEASAQSELAHIFAASFSLAETFPELPVSELVARAEELVEEMAARAAPEIERRAARLQPSP